MNMYHVLRMFKPLGIPWQERLIPCCTTVELLYPRNNCFYFDFMLLNINTIPHGLHSCTIPDMSGVLLLDIGKKPPRLWTSVSRVVFVSSRGLYNI